MSRYLIPIALSSEIDDDGMEHIHAATVDPNAGRIILAMYVTGDIEDSFVGNSVTGSYTGHGGYPPYSNFAVTSGTFPAGLSLNADGTYSGTLTTEQTYSWTISCQDSKGNSAPDLEDTADIVTQVIPPQQVWKYFQTTYDDATDYSSPSFDDSLWATSSAPFGSWDDDYGTSEIAQGAPTALNGAHTYDSRFAATFATTWEVYTRLWIRKVVNLAVIPESGIMLTVFMDDHFKCYVNGNLIITSTPNPPGGSGQTFNVPAPGLVVGDNIIAFQCDDEVETDPGQVSVAYFDMLMEAL